MKKGIIAGIVALIVVAGIGVKMAMAPEATDGEPVLPVLGSSSSGKESYFMGGSRRKKQGPKKRQNKKTKRS